MSKFYESDVQTIVLHQKNIFEPDSDSVIEALEMLRITTSAPCTHMMLSMITKMKIYSHKYKINPADESFNNQQSDHLAPQTISEEQGLRHK